MEYIAKLTIEDRKTLVDFPDCPGCQTFVDLDAGEDIEAVAREALEGWLEAHLIDGDAPPQPTTRRSNRRQERAVRVAPPLAIALQIRWRRLALDLSQAQLGKRLGVSRQQAASLEDPAANLRLSTLERVADALALELEVGMVPSDAKRSTTREAAVR